MELKEYLALKAHRANRKRPVNEESNIQIAVANYLKSKYPDVLFTIAPSGMKLGIRTAKRMKAMGYAAGTPDLLIFEPRGRWHGLFIELKTASGRLSVLQQKFFERLEARGYRVWAAFGYDHAIHILDQYFNIGEEVK